VTAGRLPDPVVEAVALASISAGDGSAHTAAAAKATAKALVVFIMTCEPLGSESVE
jgi:hypothetical protein